MTTNRSIPLVTESAAPDDRRPLWPRLRRMIFWAHLTAGCLAGLVIFLLAVTGALLTYERQIMASVEKSSWSAPPPGTERLSLDALLAAASDDGFEATQVMVHASPMAPIRISAGRRNHLDLDPYSGREVAVAAPGLEAFFSFVTRLHRWFALEGKAREQAKQVTGAANLIFVFIMLSGIVLWLPPLWKRAIVSSRLLFTRSYQSPKARDYNWHHVIGFWCLVPLFLIAVTATVFNYDWARDALRWISGAAPAAALTEQGAERGRGESIGVDTAQVLPGARSINELLETAAAQAERWNRMTVTLPTAQARSLDVTVDRGNGAQIQHQEVITLDRRSAEVIARAPRNADDSAAYARSVNRFLHTGEIFGVIGQSVAGLASLGCALLVWTGLALAWRRLILAPLRRRRLAAARRRDTGAAQESAG